MTPPELFALLPTRPPPSAAHDLSPDGDRYFLRSLSPPKLAVMSSSSSYLEHPVSSPGMTETEQSDTAMAGHAVADRVLDDQTELDNLVVARDQEDIERDIGRQADQLLTEQADERDIKRLEKTQTQKQRLLGQVRELDNRIAQPGLSSAKNVLRNKKATLENQIANLNVELDQIQDRINERHSNKDGHEEEVDGDGRLPNETRREFLIRTGKITPFSKMAVVPRTSSNLADVMLDAEEEEEEGEDEDTAMVDDGGQVSHRILTKPGFDSADTSGSEDMPTEPTAGRATKRRRIQTQTEVIFDGLALEAGTSAFPSEEEFLPSENSNVSSSASGETDTAYDELLEFGSDKKKSKQKAVSSKKKKTRGRSAPEEEDLTGLDDGNEQLYQARLQSWAKKRRGARIKANASGSTNEEQLEEQLRDAPEWQLPHPTRPDTELDDGFRIPGDIYSSLFDYQKTGVRWLQELYSQRVGGIIGDEMGLGKTIQIISFLAGLHYSGKLKKPVMVVAPATVMKQWVNEFHRWWPPLRVSILHTSGSGMMNLRREVEMEDDLEVGAWDDRKTGKSKNQKAAKKIVDRVARDGHVLVTTYSGLQTYADLLIPMEWDYAVLDEGHKIRNPNTAITIYCKELRTSNRVILSGTPMQNNLTELWSLFDFVFPMRLGTLVSFRTQFEFPIKQGGYANASNLQVETAMRCAETLKEAISPYLLQRFKVDVAKDLPKKSERVLFCPLTKLQRDSYESFLGSEEMKSILLGKRQALYGIDILRKICNHPDLVDHKKLAIRPGYDYGQEIKSGKMKVVKALLELAKRGGHKVLLFAQHRIMLDILERFIRGLDGFNYRRMDGNTSINHRQTLVDEFNNNPDLHVFLLTTKVGGLGVNLTGADRVIIYDPDWNPATDIQARERAWRLGQKREVEIYRLMTAGTIEEKIYHRQIFKQFLSNKILKDPKQRQTFHLSDLHDLFSLADASDGTQTGELFKGTEVLKSRQSVSRSRRSGAAAAPELAELAPIARQEDYHDPEQNQSGPPEDESPEARDRLLSSIFSRAGVQSAHEHDAILASNGGKRKVRADPEIITREAKRVAAEAAKELQLAGELARTVPAGTPTWTGIVGTAGRPEERPRPIYGLSRGGGAAFGGSRRGGASSSSVLSNLAARQQGPGRASGTSTPGEQQPPAVDFIGKIRDFIKVQGGSCPSKMLVDHFNRYCKGEHAERRTAEFKEMLKRVATLEKGGGPGRAKWVLKKEFGGSA